MTETAVIAWLLGLLGGTFLVLLGVISWIVKEHLKSDAEFKAQLHGVIMQATEGIEGRLKRIETYLNGLLSKIGDQ